MVQLNKEAKPSVLLYRSTTWKVTKLLEKKLDRNDTRMLHPVLKIVEATFFKTSTVRPLTSLHINHPNDTNKTCWNQRKLAETHKRDSSMTALFSKDLHTSALCGNCIQSREPTRSYGRSRETARGNQGTELCQYDLTMIMSCFLSVLWTPIHGHTSIHRAGKNIILIRSVRTLSTVKWT